MTTTTLKESILSSARVRHIADELVAIHPKFDRKNFLAQVMRGYAELSLMERLRRITECLHDVLAIDFLKTLPILRKLAPRLNNGFVTLILSDYVALYGSEEFDASMDAIKFFTTFGSSEFAIRHFLRRDPKRTLRVMERWSRENNEHVRRLASEGSRPRLPWSFRIDSLIADPAPTLPILENLKTDSSLYVRKSVANHLNDITKDNPNWALRVIESWPRDDVRTAWIAKHALRSLVKKGDARALAIIGATRKPDVRLQAFDVHPAQLSLGETLTLRAELLSTSKKSQKLVVDYAIHYVKKSGASSAKIFKLKWLPLAPGALATLRASQVVREFTTRKHYAGRHKVELMVNGVVLAEQSFVLTNE